MGQMEAIKKSLTRAFEPLGKVQRFIQVFSAGNATIGCFVVAVLVGRIIH